MIKVLLLVISLFSITFSFNKTLDSMLITQKSFLQFVAVNQLEFHTLEYQLYIKDMVQLMDNYQFNVRSALVLPTETAKTYFNKLLSEHEFSKIIDLVNIQRYATQDETAYFHFLLKAYDALEQEQRVFLEIKNLLLKKKISYNRATQYTQNVTIPDFFLKREFYEFIEGANYYNQFSFLQMSKVDPLNSIMFLSSLMQDDEAFLKENVIPIINNIDDKMIITQAYFIVNKSLGDSIKYEFDMLLNNITALTNNFDNLSENQQLRFCDIYIRNMLKSGEFKVLDSNFLNIDPIDYTMPLLRYKTALQYRKTKNIYHYADTIGIKDSLKLNYLYEIALFQLFDRQNRNKSIITKYKNLANGDGDEKRYVLWRNLYSSLNSKKKQEVSKLLEYAISLDVKNFKTLSVKLKKRTLEHKVLISFIENNYYKVQYTKEDIFEWYEAMKFLKDGPIVMGASELFFTKADLLEFYTSRQETENNDEWKQFLESRIADLSAE